MRGSRGSAPWRVAGGRAPSGELPGAGARLNPNGAAGLQLEENGVGKMTEPVVPFTDKSPRSGLEIGRVERVGGENCSILPDLGILSEPLKTARSQPWGMDS